MYVCIFTQDLDQTKKDYNNAVVARLAVSLTDSLLRARTDSLLMVIASYIPTYIHTYIQAEKGGVSKSAGGKTLTTRKGTEDGFSLIQVSEAMDSVVGMSIITHRHTSSLV